MKKFIKEFKDFISQGSAMDLAVGVIIGAAFKSIVDSLVNDILMPIVGIASGGVDFATLSLNVGSASINYGLFINAIINFIIIALIIFMIIKSLSKLKRKKAKEEEEIQLATSQEVILLREIRDALVKNDE